MADTAHAARRVNRQLTDTPAIDTASPDAPGVAATTQSDHQDSATIADNTENDAADTTETTTAHEISSATIRQRVQPSRRAIATVVAATIALSTLAGWLTLSAYHSHQDQRQRQLFLQTGKQAALNLTSIDWQQADTDVQRIVASATGTFYDDFSKRAQPFIDVVKQAKSKSVGTVTEAGIESETPDEAQVLVAVSVKTTNSGSPDQSSRAWRMRIVVRKIGNDAKVANVEFVP